MENGLYSYLKSKKEYVILFFVLLGLLICSFIAFSFLDLNASKLIESYDTTFGKIFSDFFYVIGYVPAILVNALFFIVWLTLSKKKWLKFLLGFIAHFHLTFASVVLTEALRDNSALHMSISLLIATAIFVPSVIFTRKINDDSLHKLFYLALIGVVFGTIVNSVTAGLQYTWGRNRFYYVESGHHYTPWYLPNGPSGKREETSFP